jgi:hypothetical protein
VVLGQRAACKVFIARPGRLQLTTTVLSAEQLADPVERMLCTSGCRMDLSHALVDALTPDTFTALPTPPGCSATVPNSPEGYERCRGVESPRSRPGTTQREPLASLSPAFRCG